MPIIPGGGTETSAMMQPQATALLPGQLPAAVGSWLTVNPAVLAAVELGWSMAELYAEVKPDQLQPPETPERPLPRIAASREPRRIRLQQDLPGLGSLQDRQEFQLLLECVQVGFHKLRPLITGAGLAISLPQDWRHLSQHRRSPEGRYELARSVLQFHGDLLVALTARDHQLGLGYGLGRAVADLSLRPQANSQASLTGDLRSGRVSAIVRWLKELHTVLPPHSAGAVIGSVMQWQKWAANPTWNGTPLDWNAHGQEVVGTLAAQGKRWRLLLTGQVAALDQLSPEDYVRAAGYLVGRIRKILQRLIIQYWPWVTVVAAAIIAAIVGALVLLHSPAAKGVAVAVTVFGGIGVTGRSLSSALGRTVGHVEQSLWGAELDLAAAWAITTLPDADADRQLQEPRAPLTRMAAAWHVARR